MKRQGLLASASLIAFLSLQPGAQAATLENTAVLRQVCQKMLSCSWSAMQAQFGEQINCGEIMRFAHQSFSSRALSRYRFCIGDIQYRNQKMMTAGAAASYVPHLVPAFLAAICPPTPQAQYQLGDPNTSAASLKQRYHAYSRAVCDGFAAHSKHFL